MTKEAKPIWLTKKPIKLPEGSEKFWEYLEDVLQDMCYRYYRGFTPFICISGSGSCFAMRLPVEYHNKLKQCVVRYMRRHGVEPYSPRGSIMNFEGAMYKDTKLLAHVFGKGTDLTPRGFAAGGRDATVCD